MDILYFKSSSEFRAWLEENHDQAKELWIGFYKKDSGQTGITYPEAVDQALCYGWIDGIRKRVDDASYTNRFTPRKRDSNWSAVNIRRVGELARLGLMQPPGLKVFNERQVKDSQYSYETRPRRFEDGYAARFAENPAAWEFFQAQAPSYQRTAIWYVVSAKKEETRLRRLDALIELSAQGRKLTDG